MVSNAPVFDPASIDAARLDWDKMDGLIPAIVQHDFDGRVLMQAYMNRQALEATLTSGLVTFFSRSRQALWTKGETSGNQLQLRGIETDCDGDCLLVKAEPTGPVCHLGTPTCFDRESGVGAAERGLAFLAALERLISDRNRERPADSYTTRLFESGVRRIAQKVGEEGVETALAAAAGESSEVVDEAADLLYHLLVLLNIRDIPLSDVVGRLGERHR